MQRRILPGKDGRKTCLAGVFPIACGKTSTAMLPGETILGDDIAYFRAVNGKCMAANVEAGIFGIIQDVSAKGDPVIWDVLTKLGEVIFSNVLVKDGKPYWLGMGGEPPGEGENSSGAWHKGKKDAKGVGIVCAQKNARHPHRTDVLLPASAVGWLPLHRTAILLPCGIAFPGRIAGVIIPARFADGRGLHPGELTCHAC